MDLRQLRYFVVIVEQGSFTRAAAVLGIAQPALSLHVRNMEAGLGAALLHRGPRGVVPTEAGEILLRHARIILGQLALAEEEVRARQDQPSGVVRVGLPGTISEIVSVPLIMAARRRFPQIQLRLAEAMSGFVTEWLIGAQVDLALIYRRPQGHSIAAAEVLREELVFFGPVAAVAGLGLPPTGIPVSMAMLAGLPLILPGPPHGLRALLDELAADRGTRLEPVVEADSYANIRKLAAEGMGCSVLPLQVVADEVQADRMRAWPIEAPAVRRGIYLAHSQERPMTAAVAAIHRLTHEVLLELVASGAWRGAVPVGPEAP